MKKDIERNIVIIILLFSLFLPILIIFNFSVAMFILNTLFIIVPFVLFFWFLGYLIIGIKNYFIRPSQMQKVAEKYKLNYTKIFPDNKKNIIKGKINGKNILIYDYKEYLKYYFGYQAHPFYYFQDKSDPNRARKSVNTTIIFIDGKMKKIKGFFGGFGSVEKIDNFLDDLSKEK